MTEELKQKAHDYALDNYELINIGQRDDMRAREEAYIAGATENAIHWHNLKKDPNDLPDTTRLVVVKYENESEEDVDKYYHPYGWESVIEEYSYYGPIAWCEIPKYKE